MDASLECKYRKSRQNGTIYVTTRSPVSSERQKELDLGAGEVILIKYSTPKNSKIIELLYSFISMAYKGNTQ